MHISPHVCTVTRRVTGLPLAGFKNDRNHKEIINIKGDLEVRFKLEE